MNQAEKEQYLREYALLKAKGKPFFPYAVAKDSIMAAIVVLLIAVLSIVLGAELGPKADPTTTTYVPRPEWYFFFLFELLRVVKPPELTPLATIGIPTLCMIMIIMLPFIDRSPERRPERRPIATFAGIGVIAAMAYLTLLGANAGSPNEIELKVDAKYEPGKLVAAQSGCLACHKIGENGNDGPGPNLTEIGNRLPAAAIGAPWTTRRRRCPPSAACPRTRSRRWSTSSRSSTATPTSPGLRNARGGAGPRDVRSHRGGLRRHELGHDRRPAPSLARARGRPRARRPRHAGAGRRDRHRRPGDRAGPAGRRGRRLGLLGGDARAGAGQEPLGALGAGQRARAAVSGRRVRRRHGRLRRAQLLGPAAGPARDGPRRAARRPRGGPGDNHADQ